MSKFSLKTPNYFEDINDILPEYPPSGKCPRSGMTQLILRGDCLTETSLLCSQKGKLCSQVVGKPVERKETVMQWGKPCIVK